MIRRVPEHQGLHVSDAPVGRRFGNSLDQRTVGLPRPHVEALDKVIDYRSDRIRSNP